LGFGSLPHGVFVVFNFFTGIYDLCGEENCGGGPRGRDGCVEYWNWLERLKGGSGEI